MAWVYCASLNITDSDQEQYNIATPIKQQEVAIKLNYTATYLQNLAGGTLKFYQHNELGKLLINQQPVTLNETTFINLPKQPSYLTFVPNEWLPAFYLEIYVNISNVRLNTMLKLSYHDIYLSGVWDFGLNNDPIQRVTPTGENFSFLIEKADPNNPAHNGLFYRFYNLSYSYSFTIKPKIAGNNNGTPDTIALPYGYTDLLYYADQDAWVTGKILL